MDAVDKLPEGDITKLRGREGYRLTVGGFRILFDYTNKMTSDGKLIIDIVAVGPRGDIYKKWGIVYNATRGDTMQQERLQIWPKFHYFFWLNFRGGAVPKNKDGYFCKTFFVPGMTDSGHPKRITVRGRTKKEVEENLTLIYYRLLGVYP